MGEGASSLTILEMKEAWEDREKNKRSEGEA